MGFSKPLLFAQETPGSPAKFIQPFTLPVWSQERNYQLAEQVEGIFILDFFAYWCTPCLQTSKELEQDIQNHYDSQGGNPQGLPVNVLSINVESKSRNRTDEFINKAGMRLVLDDSGGKLLAELGGKALPFIVILKGRKEDEGMIWEKIYQSSGYQGSETLRQTIDAITRALPEKTTTPETRIETPLSKEELPLEFSVAEPSNSTEATPAIVTPIHAAEVPAEVIKPIALEPKPEPEPVVKTPETINSLSTVRPATTLAPKGINYFANTQVISASDISLYSLSFQRVRDFQSADWDLFLSFGRLDIDYEPFSEADVIGTPNHLEENNQSAQVSANFARSPFFEYRISGGAYDGFSDHNSLWLDEYYRQQFSGLDGYTEADPWGYNVSGGFAWDTSSGIGILSTTFVFQQDDVAPGYDRPLFQPLERGRERLKTYSIHLEQESVITKSARMRHQLQLTKTTDRELRYRYSGNLNVAIAENWVLRVEGASTFEAVEAEEESDFKSYSGGLILEYDWNQTWFLGVEGRRYSDNGQIETSILVSSGPPPLDTNHFGVTLRHQGERSAWKLSLASYQSAYDEIDSPIRPFGNLYRNRDWLLASAAYNRSF